MEVPGGYGKDSDHSFLYMLQALRSEMWHEGNVVMTQDKTVSISPPVLTLTEMQKIAMHQVFHLKYDAYWEQELQCYEDRSWTIRLMPLEEVRQKGKETFAPSVWTSFQQLDKNKFFEAEGLIGNNIVFLDDTLTQNAFNSIYNVELLNQEDMSELRDMARQIEEQFFLLPKSENKGMHKELLKRAPGKKY